MSFRRYKNYKSTGIEWLGDVPEHWQLKRIKRLIRSIEQGWSPQCEGSPAETADDWGVLKVGCVNGGRFEPEENKALPAEMEPIPSLGIAKNDVLVSRANTRELVGSTAVADKAYPNLMLCDKLYRLKVLPELCLPSFLSLYLNTRTSRDQLELAATGASSSMLNIQQSTILELIVAVPPVVEQAAITSFVSYEAAKINLLIAEQQRLIELLSEKRQAVISHAITKGLDSSVPLKNTGVKWLGDVPSHWAVTFVSSRYSVQLGKMLDTAKITGEHLRPYLRVVDVQWGEINTEDLPCMDFNDEARKKFCLIPGDLLINEGGSYPGRAAIWNGDIDECYYQKALHRLRPLRPSEDTTRFLYFVMEWAVPFGVFSAGGNEATIEHLPAEKLRRYRFAFPPIAEQREIASYLELTTKRFSELIKEAERATVLLQERRSALISAAVTGKLDVSDAMASQPEKEAAA